MVRKGLGKFLTFLLVLVVTLGVVAVLSAASHVSPEAAADRYLRQVRDQEEETAELSAPAEGCPEISFVASSIGFLAMLVIPVAGFLAFARSKRAGCDNKKSRQSYRPRKNMSLQGTFGHKY
ncbi:hypothetical protein D7X94_00795 [Acutalibacter sp. 1XD8-33]|uniref:hypothetical protein n=1 Tax=Acutalibacter sp. 1XD8-33 TaxID=2320081 RepID=UPI000EA293CB|nr:hypothetical protein [Acutalibacter sp. 1XD8-33]RKJ42049.1 hypothetical protein D7X94_00795 [Acutalibacter sp. 1XD8-33]